MRNHTIQYSAAAMKRALKFFTGIALLTGCISLTACSGSDQAPKEIAPGEFVLDEPIQTAIGPIEKATRCAVDTINGKRPSKEGTWEIHRSDEVVLSGWALRKDRTQPNPQLFIRLTGDVQTYYAVTTVRTSRPDVNQYFRLDASVLTGYELRAKTNQIEPGIYAIMTMLPVEKEVEGCESPAMLIVN